MSMRVKRNLANVLKRKLSKWVLENPPGQSTLNGFKGARTHFSDPVSEKKA